MNIHGGKGTGSDFLSLIARTPYDKTQLPLYMQGSWKESLRTAFKNFRRDHSTSTPKKTTKEESLQPPSKRWRVDPDENDEISEQEYMEAVSEIKSEWKKAKKNRNQTGVKDLMEVTFATRRKWISSERPLVTDVVENFPCLSSTKVVSKGNTCVVLCAHFCSLI